MFHVKLSQNLLHCSSILSQGEGDAIQKWVTQAALDVRRKTKLNSVSLFVKQFGKLGRQQK